MTDRHISLARAPVLGVAIAITVSLSSCGSPADVREATVSDAGSETPESPVDALTDSVRAPRGLRANTAPLSEGYVLFNPLLSLTTYLVDVEGRVAHTWQSDIRGAGGLYLLDDGHLLRGGHQPEFPVFRGGGMAGRLQIGRSRPTLSRAERLGVRAWLRVGGHVSQPARGA